MKKTLKKPKNKAAQELAKLAHRSMTPEQRKARAKKAGLARWAKARKEGQP